MTTYQSFEQWQANPTQGAISLPPNVQEQLDQRCPCMTKPLADCNCEPDANPEFAEVTQALKAALSSLQEAYLITEKKLDKSLYVAVIGAMNACQDALELLETQPDEE